MKSRWPACPPWASALGKVGLIVAAAICGQVARPSATTADNWGVTDHTHECDGTVYSQCIAKEEFMNYDFTIQNDPDGFIRPAVTYQAQNEFTPIPDIAMFPSDFGPSNTHIIMTNMDNGFWAWTNCPSYATFGRQGTRKAWCDPQVLSFNNGKFRGKFNSEGEARSIACHEMGHLFGLRHATSSNAGSNWANSCMVISQTTNINLTNNHDEPAITNLYPLP